MDFLRIIWLLLLVWNYSPRMSYVQKTPRSAPLANTRQDRSLTSCLPHLWAYLLFLVLISSSLEPTKYKFNARGAFIIMATSFHLIFSRLHSL